jgi:hypothetical protein
VFFEDKFLDAADLDHRQSLPRLLLKPLNLQELLVKLQMLVAQLKPELN